MGGFQGQMFGFTVVYSSHGPVVMCRVAMRRVAMRRVAMRRAAMRRAAMRRVAVRHNYNCCCRV